MRWQDFRRSDNVEESSDGGSSGIGGMHLGIGGIIVVVVISLLLGKNPLDILALLTDSGIPTQTQSPAPAPSGPGHDLAARRAEEFVARVLGDTEDVWTAAFQQSGDGINRRSWCCSAARRTQPAPRQFGPTGRFIAPGTATCTSTSSFSNSCRSASARPASCARAYVIAHEVSHHVQNQLGLMAQVQQKSERASDATRNALSIRQELKPTASPESGALRAAARPDRCQGCRIGHCRGKCGRRRPAAAAITWLRRSGIVYARNLGAARALVQVRA
jgi:predicted metalloprotease